MVLVKIERVDENLIEEIVRRILSVVNPVKIILFGSYVYGKPREDSDLDILVIVDEDKRPRYKRVVPVNLALSDIIYPIDVFIYTRSEVEEWRKVPQSFITSIIKKGKVIYEKEA